jgi:hypothetical protein
MPDSSRLTSSTDDSNNFDLLGQQREAIHRTATQYEKLSTNNFGKFFLGTSIMEHENEAAENTK